VLQNPATQLQESSTVDLETLKGKKIKPYTCAVDVWAAGVLAYELVCGRPPFEVEDEVKTVTRILYCNNISFPACFSTLWSDFVSYALMKDPKQRPDAKMLLQHTWIQSNMQRAIACAPSPQHRQVKLDLMKPLSLSPRALRFPPSQASSNNHGSNKVQMPSTPQPKRGQSGATCQVLHQHLHSHFSNSVSLNCREAKSDGDKFSLESKKIADKSSDLGSAKQDLRQNLRAASPYDPYSPNPSYHESPVSRNVFSYTPTKNHPSSILGQHARAVLHTQPSLHHAASIGDLMSPELESVITHQQKVFGAVSHVARNNGSSPKPAHQRQEDTRKLGSTVLKSLCIPSLKEDVDIAHPSPGPAGPGIKERLKWHLSRQAS
jgi:serine/threonine protein kinase